MNFEGYSGATRVIFIVGDPIAQVKSPRGVSEALRARGADVIVVPAHVRSADLEAFFEMAARMPNVEGIVVTVPHKFDAARCCGGLTAAARSIGASNVARRGPDGRWFGHMCDGDGYVAGLRKAGCEPRGKRALLIGAGGAGSAIAHGLLDAGVAALALHDADVARREALAAKLVAYGAIGGAARGTPGVQPRIGSTDAAGFDLVINATPLGMRTGDTSPVQVERLEAGAFVGCVVTQPSVPPFIAAARARGHATMTGAGMFEAVCERIVDFYLEPPAPTHAPPSPPCTN